MCRQVVYQWEDHTMGNLTRHQLLKDMWMHYLLVTKNLSYFVNHRSSFCVEIFKLCLHQSYYRTLVRIVTFWGEEGRTWVSKIIWASTSVMFGLFISIKLCFRYFRYCLTLENEGDSILPCVPWRCSVQVLRLLLCCLLQDWVPEERLDRA